VAKTCRRRRRRRREKRKKKGFAIVRALFRWGIR
jgi:hypothetical protein